MPRAGLTARAALQPRNAGGEDHTPIPITSAVLHQAEIARGDATPACGAFAGVGDRVHRQACRRRAQPSAEARGCGRIHLTAAADVAVRVRLHHPDLVSLQVVVLPIADRDKPTVCRLRVSIEAACEEMSGGRPDGVEVVLPLNAPVRVGLDKPRREHGQSVAWVDGLDISNQNVSAVGRLAHRVAERAEIAARVVAKDVEVARGANVIAVLPLDRPTRVELDEHCVLGCARRAREARNRCQGVAAVGSWQDGRVRAGMAPDRVALLPDDVAIGVQPHREQAGRAVAAVVETATHDEAAIGGLARRVRLRKGSALATNLSLPLNVAVRVELRYPGVGVVGSVLRRARNNITAVIRLPDLVGIRLEGGRVELLPLQLPARAELDCRGAVERAEPSAGALRFDATLFSAGQDVAAVRSLLHGLEAVEGATVAADGLLPLELTIGRELSDPTVVNRCAAGGAGADLGAAGYHEPTVGGGLHVLGLGVGRGTRRVQGRGHEGMNP